METVAVVLAGIVILAGLVAYRPAKRWVRKCRRRKGGVYLVRVDHHRNRARRVNGYVGETVNHYLRQRQHLGHSRFDPATGKAVKRGMVAVASQPWSDLNPVWHTINLPWWLCWKWVLRPLETLVIWCTWPVYNDAKNHWNPRRIPKTLAKAQRDARETGYGVAYTTKVTLAHAFRRLAIGSGTVLLLSVTTYVWAVTR